MSTTSNPDTRRNAPPPKNPYFKLPDAKFLLLTTPPTPPATPPPAAKTRPTTVPSKDKVKALTLSQIFGILVKMSDESQAEFLMRLISNSKFEPDFAKMAKELGVKGKKGVQDRLQGLAKKHGFEVDKDNHIKSKLFDPKKDIQPIITNTKVAKWNPAIANKTTKITPKRKADPKEKTKRPVKEGEAKVKKANTKPDSKGPEANASKAIKKKQVAEKVVEAEKLNTDANANNAEQPKVSEPLDEDHVAHKRTAATVEEIEDVEMGGMRQTEDALDVLSGDI